jgi:hypothetical protein
MGLYVCNKCVNQHGLKTGWPTAANGLCEICWGHPDPALIWVTNIHRVFNGEAPTIKDQLKILANKCGCNSIDKDQCAFWDGDGGCIHPTGDCPDGSNDGLMGIF